LAFRKFSEISIFAKDEAYKGEIFTWRMALICHVKLLCLHCNTYTSFKTHDHYFGRNLDLEYSYHETVTITPRHFPLHFRRVQASAIHLAIIGIAYVNNNYPLYYDADQIELVGMGFFKVTRDGAESWITL
jgi:hypothetical protein